MSPPHHHPALLLQLLLQIDIKSPNNQPVIH
jgi:hypothetical protein